MYNFKSAVYKSGCIIYIVLMMDIYIYCDNSLQEAVKFLRMGISFSDLHRGGPWTRGGAEIQCLSLNTIYITNYMIVQFISHSVAFAKWRESQYSSLSIL